MLEFVLTAAHEQVLRDQVITGEQPGTILDDFQAVLDFIGTQGVKAGGKYNLLPIEAIPTLDQRLARPLRLQLQRPQLRSHPYLQGLHLLLRASGLGRVDGIGDKARLSVDAAMLDAWHRLNPTEQYFTLLEAWLRFGRPEMVGERGRDAFLMACVMTWRHLPNRGYKPESGRPGSFFLLGIDSHLFLLALLDLFGLLRVEHPAEPVHPWLPTRVQRTPFGDAVFTLLGNWQFADERDLETAAAPHLGVWQPLFQPHFAELRDNLALPEIEARTGTFIFRVSLGKDMWREIAMPADATLDDLAAWILRSVGFDDDHLYEFVYTSRMGATVCVSHPACEEAPFTDEVELATLPLTPGQSMTFRFDFGDDWQFNVKLERIEPPEVRIRAPRILGKHGKAPRQYPNESDW